MSITKELLIQDLSALSLEKGRCVFLHSSLKSLGYVDGGPLTVIEALLETVGDKGTLFVPAFNGKKEDSPQNPPVFHVSETPCWTGVIPETFRKLESARRSYHPTHSVSSMGPSTSFLIDEHQYSITPCNKKSPFYKNALLNGYILLIGCDQESNTTIHCCEELAEVPYHLQKEPAVCTCITEDNKKIEITTYLHDWHKPPTDFNRLAQPYLEENIMTRGKVGNTEVFLIDAAKMIDFTVNLLLDEPNFLVK